MIDDLRMTLRLAEFPNINELIVSRNVLLKLLDISGVKDVRLNVVQESQKYRFLHSVRLHGKLFIHPSERQIAPQSPARKQTLAECQ